MGEENKISRSVSSLDFGASLPPEGVAPKALPEVSNRVDVLCSNITSEVSAPGTPVHLPTPLNRKASDKAEMPSANAADELAEGIGIKPSNDLGDVFSLDEMSMPPPPGIPLNAEEEEIEVQVKQTTQQNIPANQDESSSSGSQPTTSAAVPKPPAATQAQSAPATPVPPKASAQVSGSTVAQASAQTYIMPIDAARVNIIQDTLNQQDDPKVPPQKQLSEIIGLIQGSFDNIDQNSFEIDFELDNQGVEPYKLGSDMAYKIGSTYTVKFKENNGQIRQIELKREIFTTASDPKVALSAAFYYGAGVKDLAMKLADDSYQGIFDYTGKDTNALMDKGYFTLSFKSDSAGRPLAIEKMKSGDIELDFDLSAKQKQTTRIGQKKPLLNENEMLSKKAKLHYTDIADLAKSPDLSTHIDGISKRRAETEKKFSDIKGKFLQAPKGWKIFHKQTDETDELQQLIANLTYDPKKGQKGISEKMSTYLDKKKEVFTAASMEKAELARFQANHNLLKTLSENLRTPGYTPTADDKKNIAQIRAKIRPDQLQKFANSSDADVVEYYYIDKDSKLQQDLDKIKAKHAPILTSLKSERKQAKEAVDQENRTLLDQLDLIRDSRSELKEQKGLLDKLLVEVQANVANGSDPDAPAKEQKITSLIAQLNKDITTYDKFIDDMKKKGVLQSTVKAQPVPPALPPSGAVNSSNVQVGGAPGAFSA